MTIWNQNKEYTNMKLCRGQNNQVHKLRNGSKYFVKNAKIALKQQLSLKLQSALSIMQSSLALGSLRQIHHLPLCSPYDKGNGMAKNQNVVSSYFQYKFHKSTLWEKQQINAGTLFFPTSPNNFCSQLPSHIVSGQKKYIYKHETNIMYIKNDRSIFFQQLPGN